MSFRGRFGAPWTAVGFLNGGHLHLYQENEEAQVWHLLKPNNFIFFLLTSLSRCIPEQGIKIKLCNAIHSLRIYRDKDTLTKHHFLLPHCSLAQGIVHLLLGFYHL